MRIAHQTPWSSYDSEGNELRNGSYSKATVQYEKGSEHEYELRSDGKETKVLGYEDVKLANETGTVRLLTGKEYQPLP